MTEIADGIHRVESDLGERFMCQYILAGRDRSLLVDTGLAQTPAEVLDPYLSRVGLEPTLALISHADNPFRPRIGPAHGVEDVVIFLRGIDPKRACPWPHVRPGRP